MRTIALATAAVLLFATTAAAQVSVLVQQAQPTPAVEQLPPPVQPPEVIATPPAQVQVTVPTIAPPPTPWVMQQQWEAVPVVRWGFFGRRLVPRTLYRPIYSVRPAQVVGPVYYYR